VCPRSVRKSKTFTASVALLAAVLFAAAGARAQQTQSQSQSQSQSASPTTSTTPAYEAKGFSAFEEFRGSTSDQGQILVLDSSVGYDFNNYFGVDVGVPAYFIRPAIFSSGEPHGWKNDLGDPYLDMRITADNHIVNYASVVTLSIPIRSAGLFSTGRVGVDWFNHFDHPVERFTPFGDFSIGNGTLITPLLSQPYRLSQIYRTLGFIAGFQGGTTFRLWPQFRVGASMYAYVPSGKQTLFNGISASVLPPPPPTAGGGPTVDEITHDWGSTLFVRFFPTRFLYAQAGYVHSMKYGADTATLTLGVDLTSLFQKAKAPPE
jgi:hypothetical protein